MKTIGNYFKWIFLGIVIGLVTIGVFSAFYFNKIERDIGSNKNEEKLEVTKEEFRLFIPTIDINAPILTGVDPSDEKKYDEALKSGVLLMPGTGDFRKPGNIVIYGHSSSDDTGNYTKIFRTLDELEGDDLIKIYKDGKEYVYKVNEKKVVEATDISVIKQTKDETLTLMTCWPIGTDKQRLVVIANRQ